MQLPRRFVENNLWLAFEHAHRALRERPLPPAAPKCADLARLRAPRAKAGILPLSLLAPELAEQLEPVGSMRCS